MAAKYANELSSATSSVSATSRSTISPASGNAGTSSGNWTTQGLPLLEFQQQVLHQLRELWLEERRKLQPLSSSNNGLSMSVNPSSIGDPTSGSFLAGAGDFLQFHHSAGVDGGLVAGYFASSPPSHNFLGQSELESQAEFRQTPAKEQRHQYLEPVIITNSPSTSKHHHNQPPLQKYQPPPPIIATISGGGGPAKSGDGRPTYTPGIYQVRVVSSKMNKDFDLFLWLLSE